MGREPRFRPGDPLNDVIEGRSAMRIKDTEVPQAAIDAGHAAMVDGFAANQIQAAVSAALRADATFAYRNVRDRDMDEFDMRVADRLIQNARKTGAISFAKGRWTVTGEPS